MKSRRAITPSKIIRTVGGACFALAVVLPIWPRHSLAAPNAAVATSDFLNSIGVATTFPVRGQQRAEQLRRHLSGRERRRSRAFVDGRRKPSARPVPGRQERPGACEISCLVDLGTRRAAR